MFDELLTEITAEMHPFRSQIADRHQVRCALWLARQKRIGEANARLRRKFLEGIGEVEMSIDADLYHAIGARWGYEAFSDQGFRDSLKKHNPEMVVKCESAKVMIVVPDDAWKNGRHGPDGRHDTCHLTPDTLPDTAAAALEPRDMEAA
jgi:hypothetical protein